MKEKREYFIQRLKACAKERKTCSRKVFAKYMDRFSGRNAEAVYNEYR